MRVNFPAAVGRLFLSSRPPAPGRPHRPSPGTGATFFVEWHTQCIGRVDPRSGSAAAWRVTRHYFQPFPRRSRLSLAAFRDRLCRPRSLSRSPAGPGSPEGLQSLPSSFRSPSSSLLISRALFLPLLLYSFARSREDLNPASSGFNPSASAPPPPPLPPPA